MVLRLTAVIPLIASVVSIVLSEWKPLVVPKRPYPLRAR